MPRFLTGLTLLPTLIGALVALPAHANPFVASDEPSSRSAMPATGDAEPVRIVVLPCDLAGWTPLRAVGQPVRITAAYPHPLGSLEFDVTADAPVRGWRLPMRPQRLAALDALGLEVHRDPASRARHDVAPGVRLLIENAMGQRCLLVWEPAANGIRKVPTGVWTRWNLARGEFRQVVLGPGGEERDTRSVKTLAAWLEGGSRRNEQRDGVIEIGASARVLAADVALPALDHGDFRGAADEFTIGFDGEVRTFDFEMPNPAPTSLVVDASSNPLPLGDPVTLIARMTPPTVTGEVEFRRDDLVLGRAPLVDGVARLEFTPGTKGTYTIVALYRGDGCRLAPSRGSVVFEVIIPRLIAEDARIVEGTDGVTVLQYPISMSMPWREPVTIGYATYNGWASAPDDFVPAEGQVTLAPGTTGFTVPITIIADDIQEGDERFGIDVWMAVGRDTQRVSRIVTLINDDTPPSAWIENATVVEGTGVQNVVEMKVRLTNPTTSTVFVTLQTRGGNAMPGVDYLGLRGGVSIPAGQTEAVFSVTVLGDSACEDPELVMIQFELLRAQRVEQRGVGQITINDDDCVDQAVTELDAEEPAAETLEGLERRGAGPQIALGAQAPTVDLVRTAGIERIAPNPARGPVRVEFAVAQRSPVRVSVIDVQGREVARLADGMHEIGRHVAVWNGENARGRAPAGVYFVRCTIAGKTWVRRLVVAR